MFLYSLKEADKPFCERLHRVRDLMDRSKVSIEEVISELGQFSLSLHFIITLFCLINNTVLIVLITVRWLSSQ